MPLSDAKGLTEEEFLARYDASKYERPSVTADAVLFAGMPSKDEEGQEASYAPNNLEVLLIKRGGHPFLGKWALPGGFTDPHETLEETVQRELYEETGLKDISVQQLHTFSGPKRDPRGSTVTCVFLALVDKEKLAPKAGDDAAELSWFKVNLVAEEPVGSAVKKGHSESCRKSGELDEFDSIGQSEPDKANTENRIGETSNPSDPLFTLTLENASERLQATLAPSSNDTPPQEMQSDLAFDHARIIAFAFISATKTLSCAETLRNETESC